MGEIIVANNHTLQENGQQNGLQNKDVYFFKHECHIAHALRSLLYVALQLFIP